MPETDVFDFNSIVQIMKLRILGNSVRLRLTQKDLERFDEAGRVDETLRFPGGHWLTYALEQSTEVHAISASFDGNVMTVLVPRGKAREWIGSDDVGLEATISLEDGVLGILVEKDFQCLHKPQHEEDTFPNPLAEQIADSLRNG